MKTFLLVHGAWHGSWCWNETADCLRARGHRVLAPDLSWTARTGNRVRVGQLSHCATILADRVIDLPGDLVVVGHSMGGAVISLLAEKIPKKVARLVYLSAFLLEHGQCVNDTEELMQTSLVAPNMVVDSRNRQVSIPPQLLREAFYADCDEASYQSASRKLQPQPLATFLETLNLSDSHYGSVPRSYIECTLDRAIPLEAQRQMLVRLPCDPVLSLRSGHSPFISMPETLADMLTSL